MLISEHGNLGDLQKVLATHGGKQEYLDLYIRTTKSVLRGLKVTHYESKPHRDVNPLNIFLSGDLSDIPNIDIKLGSFGHVSASGDSLLQNPSLKEALTYFSPELMTTGGGSLPSDMWALGVILH